MKAKIILLIVVIFMTVTKIAYCQGFESPSKGKAVVYFARVSSYGAVNKFKFFHADNYIGTLKGKQYLKYECVPGKHLFWATSKNEEFLTAELNEGEIYIVIVDMILSFTRAHVGLSPIKESDYELFNRAKELIEQEPPTVTPEKTIEKTNSKLKKDINKNLNKYEVKWKAERNFKHLSPDMAIPKASIK